jgi:hypothetical protein
MKQFVLFFLVIMTLATSCKKEEDDPEPQTNDPVSSVFSFYKQNTQWTYDSWDSDDPSTIISVVHKITSIDAQGYASVSWTIAGYQGPTLEWYADNSKFSKLCSKSTGKMLIYCTSSPQTGNLWTETWDTGTGNVTDSVQVMSLNETVVVPAGTFSNCIKLKETTSDDPVYYTYYWFSMSKGIIKSESTTQEDFPTIIYQELKALTIP